jgi:hypothetical protein
LKNLSLFLIQQSNAHQRRQKYLGTIPRNAGLLNNLAKGQWIFARMEKILNSSALNKALEAMYPNAIRLMSSAVCKALLIIGPLF